MSVFHAFKLNKWYQIAQSVLNENQSMDLQCSIMTGIFFIGTLIWEQGSERDSDPEIFGINPLSQVLLTRKL